MSERTTIPRREVAKRVYAREFNDATYEFKESDEERAPKYVLLPTGSKANRVFVVGTLSETKDVGDEDVYWQARVVDPSGTFFVYAGQYQPRVVEVLEDTTPPVYAAVVGKPRTYETDEGTVNVSLRPESVTQVDKVTRDRWVVETAERTVERIEAFDEANEYATMAEDKYDVAIDTYRQMVVDAVESLVDSQPENPAESGDTAEDER